MGTAINTDNMDMNLDLDIGSQTEASSDETTMPHFDGIKIDTIKVLLAHEDPAIADNTKQLYKQSDKKIHCHRVTSLEDLSHSLQQDQWDIIVGYAGSSVFLPAVISKHIQTADTHTHAIYIDDEYSATNALQIIQCGFHDYLTCQKEELLLFTTLREAQAAHCYRLAKSSEAIAAEANAKSQLLLDSTADAIAYISDGMIIHANSVFAETLGFTSASEIEFQPLIDLVIADDQIVMRNAIKQMSTDKAIIDDATLTIVNAEGQQLAVTLMFAPATHEGDACTQVVLRTANQDGTQTTTSTKPSNPVASTAAAQDNDLAQFGALENKGHIYFISLCNTAKLRKEVELHQYTDLIATITNKLHTIAPDCALIASYHAENWCMAIPDSANIEVETLANDICQKLDQLINKISGNSAEKQTAIGISKYGVADMSSESALEKAFKVCAQQQSIGGYQIFAPRIDNAQGSAALKSAMELNRLRVKYQPVVGLHNQTTQFYDAMILMQNDAGQEQCAAELISSLGLEKDNLALDYWLLGETINALSSLIFDNPNICLKISLTASAIADSNFVSWLNTEVNSSGLPRESLIFSIRAEQALSYEQQSKDLLAQLLETGFRSAITHIGKEQTGLITALKPDFAQLAASFTENLTAEEEENTKEALKQTIREATEVSSTCIATGVNTAPDLALLWQTGVPYVQGNYLQSPLSSMNYEFSDIS